MLKSSYKLFSLAVLASLCAALIPTSSLTTSANIGDTAQFTPNRLGRQPIITSSGDVQYYALPFASFNNYEGLRTLEGRRILVRNNSFDDVLRTSERIGDERQFLSARTDVQTGTNALLDDDHIGPGTDPATSRDLEYAQDPLMLNKDHLTGNTTAGTPYTNVKVRFYLYVHNNGQPPSTTGTAYGRQANNTRVSVHIPTDFEESPKITGYISADNVSYYNNMDLDNSQFASQTALDTKTISDDVVVHLTNGGHYADPQNRFRLAPDVGSLQFIEHNSTVIPAENDLEFNAPRAMTTSVGSANSFFNPTGTGLNSGMPLTSTVNGGPQITPDGTIIGCFQNSGYLTFTANIIPEPTASAPQIKKYVANLSRPAGTQTLTAINSQFFDANTQSTAVDFGAHTSTYRANYRVTVTNDGDTPITNMILGDTFFAHAGTTASPPQIVDGGGAPLTENTVLPTYTYDGSGNEVAQSDITKQVSYTITLGNSNHFELGTLDAHSTTAFYYDALVPAPTTNPDYALNDANIRSCDQTTVCGLPSQHDPANVFASLVLPTPIVDIEKYVANQVPTSANLLFDMARNSAVDRDTINTYQDADSAAQAVRFNADGTLPSSSFTGNYLVKLQKAARTSTDAFLSTITVDDSYYKGLTTYSAGGRTVPVLVAGSVTTYLKIQDNSTTPARTLAIQLNSDSSGNPWRVTPTASLSSLRFNTGAQALIGSVITLPNTAVASASSQDGPVTLTAPVDGQLLEVLFSYRTTNPAPSQTATEHSFNRASVVSYSYQNFGDPGFTAVTSIPSNAVTLANCATENFCDDAQIFTQPPTPPTVKKYVSTAVRPTSATTIPSSFIDAQTATVGSAADFGAQNSAYITYYRVAVTNTGSTTLSNLALEDEFSLRDNTTITAQNVVDNAGSTLAAATLLDSYNVNGTNEAALTGAARVTYAGVGSTTNSLRFTVPSLAGGQTIAFYYNVLVNPTTGTRPTGTGYHRNEVYTCFPPANSGCTPGSRDVAYSADHPGTVDVTITKDVNGQPADDAAHAVRVANNGTLHYLITVTAPTANGTVTLTNAHITDNMLAGLPNVNSVSGITLITPTGSCVVATPCHLANLGTALAAQAFTLAAGQSATLAYDAVGVNTTASDSAPNINTATITTDQTGPKTNPAVVIVTGVTLVTPTITITKDVNGYPADDNAHAVVVNNTDTLNYLITVRNTSTVDVTNIVLSDTMNSGLPNVTNVTNIRLITPTGACVSATPCSIANLGAALAAHPFNLAASQSATLSYSATASNTGTTDSTFNTNIATATPSNAAPVSNPAVVQVRGTAALHTDFKIRKEASPQLVHDGDEVTYTIRVTPKTTNDEIPHLNLLITDDINDNGTLTGAQGVKFTYIRNSTRIRASGSADCTGEMNDADGIRCENVGADEDIRITYRVKVSAPGLRDSDLITVDNTAQLRDDTPGVNIRGQSSASVQVVGAVTPPPPAQPIAIEKTVSPGQVKRGEIANYTIIITNPNPDAETHRVVDTIGLNNGVVPGQNGGLVRFNPDSLKVEGALFTSGTIGNPDGLTFTIPGNGRVVITYTATGEPDASRRTVSLAPNTATLDTGAYAVAFVELPTTGPAGVVMVFMLSMLASGLFVSRKRLFTLVSKK